MTHTHSSPTILQNFLPANFNVSVLILPSFQIHPLLFTPPPVQSVFTLIAHLPFTKTPWYCSPFRKNACPGFQSHSHADPGIPPPGVSPRGLRVSDRAMGDPHNTSMPPSQPSGKITPFAFVPLDFHPPLSKHGSYTPSRLWT